MNSSKVVLSNTIYIAFCCIWMLRSAMTTTAKDTTVSTLTIGIQCSQGSFNCNNHQRMECIGEYQVCDGMRNHCTTAFDEDVEMCHKRQCPNDMFRCSSGQCISLTKFCKGALDGKCLDGSHWGNINCSVCPTWEDDDVATRCQNGKCLLQSHINDCEVHCSDASDERKCKHEKDALTPVIVTALLSTLLAVSVIINIVCCACRFYARQKNPISTSTINLRLARNCENASGTSRQQEGECYSSHPTLQRGNVYDGIDDADVGRTSPGGHSYVQANLPWHFQPDVVPVTTKESSFPRQGSGLGVRESALYVGIDGYEVPMNHTSI